jgi:prepilin-type processing-associated H-X9-DG protein
VGTAATSSNAVYGMNWAIAILPFIEQDNLYKAYRIDLPNIDPLNQPVCRTYVKTYSCPSDTNANQLFAPETSAPTGGATPSGILYMTGSYRGMSGVSWNQTDMFCGYPQESLNCFTHQPTWKGLFHTDFAGGPQPEKITNVRDGTSNTLMVGERTTRTHPTRGTFWADSFNLYSLSAAYSHSITLNGDYDLCIAAPGEQDTQNRCKYGWGSPHAGIINFVFVDGSVRGINQNIDMITFQALSTIANGEIIPDF